MPRSRLGPQPGSGKPVLLTAVKVGRSGRPPVAKGGKSGGDFESGVGVRVAPSVGLAAALAAGSEGPPEAGSLRPAVY